jgi:hypothetical protein
MSARCPCCGGAIAATPVAREDLAGLVDSDSEVFAAIVRRLAWRPGQLVATRQLIEAAWGHDPEGGPLHADRVIRQTIMRHRHRLEPLGWRLKGALGAGGGYRLILARER